MWRSGGRAGLDRRADILSAALLGTLAAGREAIELAAILGRLARDLPPFLRQPLGLEEARSVVRRQLETRERRFLAVVERAIYGRVRSPYRRLLEAAGCQLGDLQRLVTQEGLEGALGRLADLGVYVTYDEFKGRSEAVRGSQRFSFSDRDFDNPLQPIHFRSSTSGSRGRPGRVIHSLAFAKEVAVVAAVTLSIHGLLPARHVYWVANPIHWMIVYGKLGQPSVAWYYPLAVSTVAVSAWALALRLVARRSGWSLPAPRFHALQDAERMAVWLARQARPAGMVLVTAPVSAAARVASAASRLGLSLRGVAFFALGEPLTQSRRSLIEASGAAVIGRYSTMETGLISVDCARRTVADDMHFLADRWALVQRPRLLTADGPSVDALTFTSLSPASPKILLNTDLGDYADVTDRPGDCCGLGQLGLTTHLSNIRSFEKLTGEGTTFARTNLLYVLEAILPARFGGTGLDYQLVEEEGADSLTRLVLRVHPSVGPIDETLVRATLLEELGRGGSASSYHAETLRRAESVEICRQPPIATPAGKILPFHLAQSLIERAAGHETFADARG